MDDIIATTTSSIDGYKVIKYIKLVTANIVIGTSIFSDFFAGITDFTGGKSNTYQDKLQDMYQTAIRNLKEDARRTGANCVLGMSIDLDEISGKNMQMFMLNAIGTAVYIVSEKDYEAEIEQEKQNRINQEKKNEEDRKKTIELNQKGTSAKTIEDLLQIYEIRNEANTIKRLYGEDRYNHFLKSKAREFGIEE